MKLSFKAFLFTLLPVFVFQVARSQGLADTTQLVKTIPVLNGKVSFKFPAQAVLSPRVADIMAADPNANRETRIIFDVDTMKLVFFAQEIFSLSGDNLFETITKSDPADAAFTRKLLLRQDSVVSIITTPSEFDSLASAILVNSLLVKTPDNTVFKLDAFINGSAYGLRDQYIRLTENIFNTLLKGDRRVDLSPHEEVYKLPGRSESLQIKLPKNYAVTVDEKYDFVVYKLNRYTDVMDTTYTSLTLYVGSFPTYFHKEYGLAETDAKKVKGKMFQMDVDWLYFEDISAPFFLKEQFVPLDELEKGLVMHVAMIANQRKLVDELTGIVNSIRVVK